VCHIFAMAAWTSRVYALANGSVAAILVSESAYSLPGSMTGERTHWKFRTAQEKR